MKLLPKFSQFITLSSICIFSLNAYSQDIDYNTMRNKIDSSLSETDKSYIKDNYSLNNIEKNLLIYDKLNSILPKDKLELKVNSLKQRFFNNELNKIPIIFSYGIPNDLFNENFTESSVSHNSMDLNKQCIAHLKLFIDNNSRLFESSELSWKKLEDISNESNESLDDTIVETILHEASHCILQNRMKDSNFNLLFSDKYSNYPFIKDSLNSLIKNQVLFIKNNQKKELSIYPLNNILFHNFHENFADVMSAFLLIKNPNDIYLAKNQLIRVMELRNHTDINHQTTIAIQHAYSQLDKVSSMSDSQKIDFAIQIASESLLSNIYIINDKILKLNNIKSIGLFLLSGISIENNKATLFIPKYKEKNYENLVEELNAMNNKQNTIGTITQNIRKIKEIISEEKQSKINP